MPKPKFDPSKTYCMTCEFEADVWNSNEGYSHCCNDRIAQGDEMNEKFGS